jgi:hypothetical protein
MSTPPDFIGPDEHTPAKNMIGVNSALDEMRGSLKAHDVIMLDMYGRVCSMESTVAEAVKIVHERRAPDPRIIHAGMIALVITAISACTIAYAVAG